MSLKNQLVNKLASYFAFVFIVLISAYPIISYAEGLSVSTVTDKTLNAVIPGDVVTITSTYTNSFLPTPPFDITFPTSYRIGLLPEVNQQTIISFTKTRPISLKDLVIPLGANLTYIANSAKVNSVNTTNSLNTETNTLSISLNNATLNESGGSLSLCFQVAIKQ